MKIFYSIDREGVKIDLTSIKDHPINSFTRSDILDGIGFAEIAIVFHYWNQEVVVVEDSLLSFFYNFIGALVKLKNRTHTKLYTFSSEQGFKMELIANGNNVEIHIFDKIFIIDVSLLLQEALRVAKYAFEDMEIIYSGLEKNEYFNQIKKDLFS